MSHWKSDGHAPARPSLRESHAEARKGACGQPLAFQAQSAPPSPVWWSLPRLAFAKAADHLTCEALRWGGCRDTAPPPSTRKWVWPQVAADPRRLCGLRAPLAWTRGASGHY